MFFSARPSRLYSTRRDSQVRSDHPGRCDQLAQRLRHGHGCTRSVSRIAEPGPRFSAAGQRIISQDQRLDFVLAEVQGGGNQRGTVRPSRQTIDVNLLNTGKVLEYIDVCAALINTRVSSNNVLRKTHRRRIDPTQSDSLGAGRWTRTINARSCLTISQEKARLKTRKLYLLPVARVPTTLGTRSFFILTNNSANLVTFNSLLLLQHLRNLSDCRDVFRHYFCSRLGRCQNEFVSLF